MGDARVLVALGLAVATVACTAGPSDREWACAKPEHGDYFMEELFETPAAALASVDDQPSRYRPVQADTGRAYVLQGPDGRVARLVELQLEDDQWGVVSVTSCTGFG